MGDACKNMRFKESLEHVPKYDLMQIVRFASTAIASTNMSTPRLSLKNTSKRASISLASTNM